jgi:molybdopterin biosynthesis enzyme
VNNLNDCFKVTDTWITVAEAIKRFSRLLGGISQIETVSIRDSLARILASQLTSKHNIL